MLKLYQLAELSKKRDKLYPILITLSAYRVNDELLEEVISKLTKLSSIEETIINNISSQELDTYLNELIKNSQSEPRIFGRLLNKQEILIGNLVERKHLSQYPLPSNLSVSTYDFMLSKINIDVMKSLKRKLDDLIADCDSDIEFIEMLKEELELAKIDYLHRNLTSEILALNANNDLDEIPTLIMPPLKNKDDVDSSESDLTERMLSLYISTTLSKIENTQIIENTPSKVFAYLLSITRLEVILDYMPENVREDFYNQYVTNQPNKTNPSIQYVKELIKQKLSKES